jgi:DNA invertase Pin-like site-specific DNA recombinase
MTRKSTETRCVIYLRVSLDVTGEQLAVARHRKDCQRIAHERGWQVVREYVDNSVSASDKRKKRPAYDQMVTDYAAGQFDALVCWDLDRLTRQPRQLEDWIDAAEERGLLLVTANGEADLSTDGGRLFARIKASVARAEVERKAARQRLAAAQRAEHGKPPAGVRLTGYTTGGQIVPHEAELVRRMFARFAAGDSLRGIVAWLTEESAPTRNGKAWSPSTVRTILTNPRYAGRAIYQGRVNGHAGAWPAIVDDATFDVVAAKLADPRRRTQVGTHRRHLGSSLYLCGVCDTPVVSHSGGRYRCREGGHVTRIGASIDDYVRGVIRARLERPDLADVLTVPESGDARDAAADLARLRARLVTVEADYDAGHIDGRRFKVATDKIAAQIAQAEAARVRSLADAAVASTLTAEDPAAAFEAAPLGTQRAIVDFFATVRLMPAPRGHKFDPATVKITPKGAK